VPGFAAVSEAIYRWVAAHRLSLSRIERLIWGPGPPAYHLTRRWFLRALGLIYSLAFVSLGVQVEGLVGSNGILPAAQFLDRIAAQVGAERYWLFPTWCWLGSGDGVLGLLCWGGAAGGALVALGVLPGPLLLLLWTMYLSLAVVGQTFLHYQWDALLLETGLLAIFFAPWGLRPRLSRERPPAAAFLWLLRFLLFRLTFLSGFVKLASRDEVWWNLTALDYHYWTQPIPTWTAWYAHQMPSWFHKASVLGMFGVELIVPFLIFLPRRVRIASALPQALLQIGILATGNYGFFNLLTLALCILLLDDSVLGRLYPARLRERVPRLAPAPRWRALALLPAAAALLVASGALLAARLGAPARSIPRLAWRIVEGIAPLRSVNNYGLFANMTETRPEIEIEGSRDGQAWETYVFRWKPGDPKRRPPILGSHMPRLDWQMWFAALQGFDQAPWLRPFLAQLLRGSPEVRGLLERDPFAGDPPRYLRLSLYEYRFTTVEEHRRTGAWWERTWKGLYAPVLTDRRPPAPGRSGAPP
jgi:hypothetical protein